VRQSVRGSVATVKTESVSWPHALIVEARPIGRLMLPCAIAIGLPA